MEKQSLNHPRVTQREHSKPVVLLERSSRKFRKRYLKRLQVRECGGRECFSVMEEIEVTTSRESGLTSTWSFMTREFEKLLKRKSR